jgi:putative SOS response-associated peptidase YedK
MCGRFTLTLEISALQMAFDLGEQSVQWTPNYNVAPSMSIPVVTNENPQKIDLLEWGLIPAWSKDSTIAAKLINARSETAPEKPSFRGPFKNMRCLIFADGFYEWKKSPNKSGTKTPYYFRRIDQQPFVFAGLWDSWAGNEQEIPRKTCTILTCEPNETVALVHDRMPVIFNWQQGQKWLSKDTSVEDLVTMMKPLPASELIAFPVSTLVNKPENNSPACIKPQENLTLF